MPQESQRQFADSIKHQPQDFWGRHPGTAVGDSGGNPGSSWGVCEDVLDQPLQGWGGPGPAQDRFAKGWSQSVPCIPFSEGSLAQV